MRIQTVAILGAVTLALGLASSSGAASFVDVTYELSDTSLGTTLPDCASVPSGSACTAAEILSSNMKIRYASNSQSSMPILHGPATLLSLTLNAKITFYTLSDPFTSADANVHLLSPVVGSLLSGGTLTFANAQFSVTGSRHCAGFNFTSGLCVAIAATLTSRTTPLGPFTNQATFTLAASAGPYGGAQSTRHTASGTFSLSIPSKLSPVGQQFGFATAAGLVGREVLREADGHDPKVIPEPGTLLLLGVGTAGLGLVGRVTRRSRPR